MTRNELMALLGYEFGMSGSLQLEFGIDEETIEARQSYIIDTILMKLKETGK